MSLDSEKPAVVSDSSSSEQASLSLAAVLKEARINEEKLIHLQTMEMKLLTADSFYEVCQTLIDDYRRQFNLRAVTLTLLDRGKQLRMYLEETEKENASQRLSDLEDNVFFVSDYEDMGYLQTFSHQPVLGKLEEKYERFFGGYVEDVESLALLPLVRKGELIGFLALGSVDPQRYSSDMAADFVTRLASIVAVCVQNAVHLEQVKLMSLVDPLTQLYNRRYFIKRMIEEIKRALRGPEVISCLHIDVNDFKSINEQYGQDGGDIILMHVARVIEHATRDSDIPARIEGKGFGVVLPATSESGARDAARRIVEAFNEMPCDMGRDNTVSVSVTIGASSCDTSQAIAEPSVLCSTLVDQACSALKAAKRHSDDAVVHTQV